MQGKRMFKVISAIEKPNGAKWWMRCGTGFLNKDDSINLYIDALPIPSGKEIQLQVRELTEEDLRANEAKRAQFSASRTVTATSAMPTPGATPASTEPLPF